MTIENPSGVQVVGLAVPTEHPSIGEYGYTFEVPGDAPTGPWEVTWSGVIDGEPVAADSTLDVLPAAGDGGAASGPCSPWIEPAAICGYPEDPDEEQADRGARAVAIATEVLWGMSGRRIGACPLTVRPLARPKCALPWRRTGVGSPLLVGGVWIDHVGRDDALVLSPPAAELVAAVVDGEAVEAVLYDRRFLYRVDGQAWPSENDLLLDDSQPGTWSVSYLVGEAPSTLAQEAAAELAGEFYKALCGDEKTCRLPARTQSITRRGITVTMADRELRSLGLRVCDIFLDTVNPERLAMPSGVYSPDVRPGARPS